MIDETIKCMTRERQTVSQTDITLVAQVSRKGGRANLDMYSVHVVTTHVSAACQDAGEHPTWGQHPLGGSDPNGYALVPHCLIIQSKHQHRVHI